MSSLARKIKRQQLRDRYKRFQIAWDDEKRFQQYLIAAGKAKEVISEDGQRVIVGGSGEQNTPVLGRKPTFKMWAAAVKNKQITPAGQAPPKEEEKRVEVDDLSWGEGG